MRQPVAILITVLVGFLGGLLADFIGLPVGSLLGASIAVGLLAGFARIGVMPAWLRDLAFTLIGVSLGGGIDPDLSSQIGGWIFSLGLLTLSLIATLWLGAAALQIFAGLDRETAFLASAPGTMSNVIALSAEGRGDPVAVMALQVLRVLAIVITVPPLATMLGADGAPGMITPDLMGWQAVLILTALSFVIGRIGKRLGVPASCLLFGLMISAGAHAGGVVTGLMPSWGDFAGFAIVGAALGTQITGISGAALRRIAVAGLVMMAVTLAVSMVFSLIAMALLGLPLAQVWIAFAPGGVEAMAAIGLSLGYDPAFIALHHFVRILLLVVLVPLAVGRRGSSVTSPLAPADQQADKQPRPDRQLP